MPDSSPGALTLDWSTGHTPMTEDFQHVLPCLSQFLKGPWCVYVQHNPPQQGGQLALWWWQGHTGPGCLGRAERHTPTGEWNLRARVPTSQPCTLAQGCPRGETHVIVNCWPKEVVCPGQVPSSLHKGALCVGRGSAGKSQSLLLPFPGINRVMTAFLKAPAARCISGKQAHSSCSGYPLSSLSLPH